MRLQGRQSTAEGLTREETTFFDHLAQSDVREQQPFPQVAICAMAMKKLPAELVEILQGSIGIVDFWSNPGGASKAARRAGRCPANGRHSGRSPASFNRLAVEILEARKESPRAQLVEGVSRHEASIASATTSDYLCSPKQDPQDCGHCGRARRSDRGSCVPARSNFRPEHDIEQIIKQKAILDLQEPGGMERSELDAGLARIQEWRRFSLPWFVIPAEPGVEPRRAAGAQVRPVSTSTQTC